MKDFAVEPAFLLVATIQVIHLFVYLIVVRGILRQYNIKIRNTKSSLDRINLRWLLICTTLYSVVFGFIQLLTTLQAFGIHTVELYHTSIPLIVTAIIYGLGYMGLPQPEIFSPAEEGVLPVLGVEYEAETRACPRPSFDRTAGGGPQHPGLFRGKADPVPGRTNTSTSMQGFFP